MNLKTHRIPMIFMILLSIFLVELAHQTGGCIAEIFIEHSHDNSNVPASVPDLLEETAKEDYLHSEDYVALISDFVPLNTFTNLMIVSLYEQNVLVPPPDSIS